MEKRRFSQELIITYLRQVETMVSQGKAAGKACQQIGVTEQTFYRWRKHYGGMEVDQLKHLKALEQGHSRLKGVVAEQALTARPRLGCPPAAGWGHIGPGYAPPPPLSRAGRPDGSRDRVPRKRAVDLMSDLGPKRT